MATAVTPARGAMSPASSPRLPSPPPMPELQFSPQSPLARPAGEDEAELRNRADEAEARNRADGAEARNRADESARRRTRPGTRAADMAKGPPLIPLTQVDSAFPLQEHLKALYAHLTYGQDANLTTPMSRETAQQIARPPHLDDGDSADRNLWLYELCRFLTMKAGLVSCALMEDKPACSSSTCPEMRASEWQYLCAVHEPPKSCCAIDYVNHTLDWAANMLTSTKHFPSRLQLGGETGSIMQSMRQLTNIFRRVYRIFAHAWFQHREVFWHIEAAHGIYMLFKTVCDEYRLIPEDNYTIPPEAEGPREEVDTPVNATSSGSQAMSMQILRKDAADALSQNGADSSPPKDIPAATARRHRHTPSTGSHVTTITEDEEDIPAVPSVLKSHGNDGVSTPSPERKAREALGKLNISETAPLKKDNSLASQLEGPTPTAAPVSDPLAAAGAASLDPDSSSISKQESAKLDNSSSTANTSSTNPPHKPLITNQPRRTSDFESEVHSPGGGSIRTAGPDLLGAILGHMDDKEREEVEASRVGESEGEETVLFVGEEEEEDEDEKDTTGKEDKHVTKTQKHAGGGGGGDDDDDDDNNDDGDGGGADAAETMEEIMLPHRREAGS